MDWDEEAQQNALYSARQAQSRDPEAAALIVTTLAVTQDIQEENGELVDRSPNGYNPIKIYDYACREYGWRPRDIDEMHYLTFFAMVENANERHRRENDAFNM